MTATSRTFVALLPERDLPLGHTTAATLPDGRRVLVAHTADGWLAVDADCSHAGAPLEEGALVGCRVVCPWHSAVFDLRDGGALGGPARRAVRSYPVSIRDGMATIDDEER